MALEHAFGDYAAKQTELSSTYMSKCQQNYFSHVNNVQKLAANARGKAQELWQNYLQELRAIGAGDDTAERAAAACLKFQREYSKLDVDYVKSCRDSYKNSIEALETLRTETDGRGLENLVSYLDDLRNILAGKAARGVGPTDGGGKKSK